jgi:hypothetical protein
MGMAKPSNGQSKERVHRSTNLARRPLLKKGSKNGKRPKQAVRRNWAWLQVEGIPRQYSRGSPSFGHRIWEARKTEPLINGNREPATWV